MALTVVLLPDQPLISVSITWYRTRWSQVWLQLYSPAYLLPLLLEAIKHQKVESGSSLYSIFNSTKYAGADCRSHTLIPVIHAHEQLFAVLSLHCSALHCTELHCTALHRTAHHWTALSCTTLHCNSQHCTASKYGALHCKKQFSPDECPDIP